MVLALACWIGVGRGVCRSRAPVDHAVVDAYFAMVIFSTVQVEQSPL